MRTLHSPAPPTSRDAAGGRGLPGDRRLAGRSHLGARRFGGPYVGHVLSEFENALEVLGIDDRSHPPTPPGQVDRDVLGTSPIDDRRKLLARV